MLEDGFLVFATLFATSLFAAFSAVLGLAYLSRPPARLVEVSIPTYSDKTIILLDDNGVIDATACAYTFFERSVDDGLTWAGIFDFATSVSTDLGFHLRAFRRHGTPFQINVQHRGETVAIFGHKDAGLFRVFIGGESDKTVNGALENAAIAAREDELSLLRSALEVSPVIIWKVGGNNEITWANQAYISLLRLIDPAREHLVWPLPVLFPVAGSNQSTHPERKSLRLPGQAKPLWFEETTFASNDGGSFHYAIHADPVVRAEESLRNFVQTLTQTFAHLPIGLAVFDRNRQLALFNPALMDLTALDPQWLTGRPTLSAFLDRLRENRHIPEPKNYKSWRNRIAVLEQASVDGTYEENWSLPSGQTYKVIGRPHPEGAVALLFEDITAALSLQRQFRSELELGQSVIDRMPDAIAVFSPGNELVMSNSAFARLWGFDPGSMVARLDFSGIKSLWLGSCTNASALESMLLSPAPRFGDSHEIGTILHKSGNSYAVTLGGLARGATICTFQLTGQHPIPQKTRVLLEA